MPKISKYYWFVIASGIISGIIVFGGQTLAKLGFSLFEITTIPYLLPLLILLPIFLFSKRKLTRSLFLTILLYGFIEAGIVFCQFAAPILGATVTLTLLLLYIQPLWTTIASKFFFKEKVTQTNVIACVLVLSGIIILINPFNISNIGSLAGIIVATLGGIFLSGWVSVGSHLSKSGVRPTDTMFMGSLTMVTLMFVGFPIIKLFIHDPALVSFSFDKKFISLVLIISFGIVTFLINHFAYLKGTKKVSTADAGVIMLLEPIVGAILATVFLHQPITIGIVIGGALILVANYLVIRSSGKTIT